ncbi:hypothetical protein TSOC_009204 [Tetrabaena socialis]|uniref:Uracil-DNA glycosylase-like domain-containing protein n=1 Tax=Tetrabaena socialis TaxID=47790 RepID=A0A2J7ZWH6_9CHLO|nr:hypothetical protein TSOC_009204 [Tetrabaena socialis]|eukprot:PNH04627.1 hypothetical protein TSOC_009204 [Tetrabaena socialis]
MSDNVFERFKCASASPLGTRATPERACSVAAGADGPRAAKRARHTAASPSGPVGPSHLTASATAHAHTPAPSTPATSPREGPPDDSAAQAGQAGTPCAANGEAGGSAVEPEPPCGGRSSSIPDAAAAAPATLPPLRRRPPQAAARAPPAPAAPPAARGRAASRSQPAAAPSTPPARPATTPPAGVPEKLGDAPLRLVIVGHNPSAHAWQSGHYYSNPSNHMWRILIRTGIAPPGTRGPQDDGTLPAAAGVGFLDVGCGHPGTDRRGGGDYAFPAYSPPPRPRSSEFKSAVFERWARAFYTRLRDHMARAAASIGCTCGRCGAPCLVAFSGKRQFLELLNLGRAPRERAKTVEHGPQAALPSGWPLPAATQVWVCSSTSGAAAMTREQREGPYEQLAAALAQLPWPRLVQPWCAGGPAAGAGAAAAGAGAAGAAAAGAAGGGGTAPPPDGGRVAAVEGSGGTAGAVVEGGGDGGERGG